MLARLAGTFGLEDHGLGGLERLASLDPDAAAASLTAAIPALTEPSPSRGDLTRGVAADAVDLLEPLIPFAHVVGHHPGLHPHRVGDLGALRERVHARTGKRIARIRSTSFIAQAKNIEGTLGC